MNPPEDAQGYVYDVFVSHKREPPGQDLITPWLTQVVNRVQFWLGHGLGGVEARVFFDLRSLGTGTRWPVELQRAIATSRCLLPFWSPGYFRSRWCLAEWRSFQERERVAGDGACLIVPVTIHDGAWFPADARQVMALDLRAHVGTTPGFWATRRADELDLILQEFSGRLAEVVLKAPPYQAEWPLLMPPDKLPPPPRGLPLRGL